MGAAETLLPRWRARGLEVGTPTTAAAVAAWEQRTKLTLPRDLVALLLQANGLAMDGNFFEFWSLEQYEVLTATAHEGWALPPAPERYVIFGDYLIWSWAYAIRCDPGCEDVVPVGTLTTWTVAGSLSEFAELVLANSARLYPP